MSRSSSLTALRLLRRPADWLAWLALALLLSAQGLGQLHRVAHAGAHGAARLQAQGPAKSAADWGHVAGSADCQLFDQLGHVDGLPDVLVLPLAALPAAPAAGPLARSARLPARWSLRARAPPALG